jgi:carboxyl-terminal processing protease
VAGSNGIIIDLRNNLGGLLSSTINVTSQFIKSGLVLYSVDSNNNRIDYQVNEDLHVTDLPIAVIVNQYSASGSEVMAGALQDHERAILIGTQTFGKGSVNLPKILKNGSGMYFTVGRWYSPNGHIIEGQGLTPNIIVDRADNGSDSDKDKQLELAIDYLQGQFSNDSR